MKFINGTVSFIIIKSKIRYINERFPLQDCTARKAYQNVTRIKIYSIKFKFDGIANPVYDGSIVSRGIRGV